MSNEMKFIAQPYLGSLQGWRGALGGIFFLSEDVKDSAFDNIAAGPAFLYLFRRFGFPIRHCDDDKEVCSYHITTPLQNVVLWIKISASQAWFGYLLDSETHRACEKEEWEDLKSKRAIDFYKTAEDSMRYKCWKALLSAIDDLDLATPIRDEYINVLGPIKDEKVNDYDCVERSPMAGYGIEIGPALALINDTNEWFKLLHNLTARGNGDFLAGLRLTNKELQLCSMPL